MNVKHFYLRLSKETLQKDEEVLNSFLQTVLVKKTAIQLISKGEANYWSILVFYTNTAPLEEHPEKTTEKLPTFDASILTSDERNRYDVLRTWRADTATKENSPQYIIAHNSQLGLIAKLNPTTTDELLKVKGLGVKKVAKYGDEIIAVLNSI
jgi:superfamily II DNA helicase RecQ